LKDGALTTGQVAKICSVSQRTVINWINKKALNAYLLPGRGDRRVPIEELRRFMGERGISESALDDYLLSSKVVNRKVLVVDDDRLMARAMARSLSVEGFDVSVVYSGFEAGLMVERLSPSLVVLDLQMPDVSGFDVLRVIKSDCPGIHVLVVSGAGEEMLARALKSGADAVLAKPYDDRALHRLAEKLAV
jgi:excisionase family DNA binding protein